MKKQKQDENFVLLFCGASDSALNLIGTEASRTDVHMAGRTVNDRFYALYVGLPSSVGATVGVGDFDAERHTLTAKIALCQLLHLQSLKKSALRGVATQTKDIIAKFAPKCKRNF